LRMISIKRPSKPDALLTSASCKRGRPSES